MQIQSLTAIGADEVIRDLGIAGFAILIMFLYAKWQGQQIFKQVIEANKQVREANLRAEDSQKEFRLFVANEYKRNQEIIAELMSSFKQHIATKDTALEILKEIIYDRNVPKEYRKYLK